MIIISADVLEIQPSAEVTLKLYVPGIRFEIVEVVPVPDIAPGLIVHVPVAGKPVNTTLPVVAEHDVGCVIAPKTGAVGAVGA